MNIVIGIAWYRREHYNAVLRIMADREQFASRYEKWLYEAERGEKRLARNGHVIIRAYIDPETFPDWCRARGLNIDAEARKAFANEVALMSQQARH